MSSPHGKLAWTDTSGDHSFVFEYFARQVPYAWMVATRHDNIASSGVKEAVLERIDNFTDFEMEFVLTGSDISNWNTFMAYALQGNQFQFYEDSDSTNFVSYTLEDTEWKGAYKAPQLYNFKVKFRKVV